MTDVAVDTVRLRGPGARRLARVAATVLPRALDRALADVDDLEIDCVTVVLELDLDDYDDETLAVLWADAIRERLMNGTPRTRVRRPVAASARGQGARPGWEGDEIVAAARTWLSRDPSMAAHAVPSPLLGLGDPMAARRVRSVLTPAEWERLVLRLADVLGVQAGSARDGRPTLPEELAPGPARRTVEASGEADARSLPDGIRPMGRPPTQRGGGEPEARVLSRLAELDALAGGGPLDLAVATLTRAAGLVLLYPWLADHCRRAEGLHPALDPLDVREAALGAVLSDDDPVWLADPLVRLLAGRPDPLGAESHERAPLARAADVAESAREVLSSFAALLPGFERSSAAYVRGSWVVRVGTLDVDHDPVLLTASTHPLDVVLPRLPYPVGLVKLPWSPPLSVRFR